MLEIRMASGDVLIHDDQQPDAMTIKGYDGSQVLVHAGEWGRHKYIRKEGNRYIYPEDLQKAAQRGYEVVKKGQKIASTANDFIKTKAEIAKYATKDALRKGSEAASKTAETTKQKAKNIYDDRKIYADAAKNMTYDVVKGSKIGKLYKTAQDVVGDVKSEAAVNRSQVTAGHKKKSSVSFKKPISQVSKPAKNSDSVERSTPTKEEVKKRIKSHVPNEINVGLGDNEIKVSKKGIHIGRKSGYHPKVQSVKPSTNMTDDGNKRPRSRAKRTEYGEDIKDIYVRPMNNGSKKKRKAQH